MLPLIELRLSLVFVPGLPHVILDRAATVPRFRTRITTCCCSLSQANFELQTRVPLLIRAPWLLRATAVGSTTALAELVDLLPTAV